MASSNTTSRPGHLRIATEEAWATREMLDLYRRMLAENTPDDPGFKSLWGFYLNSPSPRATFIIDRLQELGQPRLDDMDKTGIDKQILMLTSPGVQVFEAATAVSLAISSNDQLAQACRKHPDRYAGMAAIAVVMTAGRTCNSSSAALIFWSTTLPLGAMTWPAA